MKQPKRPCYNCKDRRGGCHAECEKYAEFAEAQHLWRDAVWKESGNSALSYLIDMRLKLRDKTNKEKMRRGK